MTEADELARYRAAHEQIRAHAASWAETLHWEPGKFKVLQRGLHHLPDGAGMVPGGTGPRGRSRQCGDPVSEDVWTTEKVGNVETSHLGGVAWYDAPLPPKSHSCWVQTDGWIGFRQVQRCACGAIRGNGARESHWALRNERRKQDRRTARRFDSSDSGR